MITFHMILMILCGNSLGKFLVDTNIGTCYDNFVKFINII